MNNQATKLKELMQEQSPLSAKKTRFVAITSGKGGVGKSTISANIAHMLSKRGFKVGLFDADLGLANLDIILGVSAPKNILHVVKGEATLDEVVLQIAPNFYLIPGDSGEEILRYSDENFFRSVLSKPSMLDAMDVMIIDTGAGIGEHTQLFLKAADDVIVVAIPDPAAITDAYAMIKVNSTYKSEVGLLLNQVKTEKEAQMVYEKIVKVASKNISTPFKINYMGHMRSDEIVSRSIKSRSLFTKDAPTSAPSKAIGEIVQKIALKLERNVLVGAKESGLNGLFKRLFEQF
ncbi:MAG: ATP-binding protein [Sulfuricurvum sp. PC08-66]|nr:MAG: ATP-binding protein [Sulfuricurvum sp. PC08-66]